MFESTETGSRSTEPPPPIRGGSQIALVGVGDRSFESPSQKDRVITVNACLSPSIYLTARALIESLEAALGSRISTRILPRAGRLPHEHGAIAVPGSESTARPATPGSVLHVTPVPVGEV
jgi:hypothetical protein